jgi:hypothetical protein
VTRSAGWLEQCFRAAESTDREAVLRLIDDLPRPMPGTDDLLNLAESMSRRGHFQASETVLWKILCRPGDEFPSENELARIPAAARTLPREYGASPRLIDLTRLLTELDPALLQVFRWGERPSNSSARRFVSPRFVGDLVRIIEDHYLYPKDSPGGGWAPIHALRLLSEIGDARALEPMLRGVTRPEIFDYAQRELGFALGRMGGPALEPTLRALSTPDMDEFQIISLLRILRDVAVVDPECRSRVASVLLDRARDDSLPPEVRGYAVRYLIEMEAAGHEAEVRTLLEDPFFDRGVSLASSRLREEWRKTRVCSGLPERRRALISRFDSLYP